MGLTPHHAKYFANDLTRRATSGMNRLSMALFDAAVDLNPHQIEAALFALQSPLSKGVILADEVGLGKTIEAGIVLCQFWAERKRRLLVICPASIRKQWALELEEKFNLPTRVLDAKAYREAQRSGRAPLNETAVLRAPSAERILETFASLQRHCGSAAVRAGRAAAGACEGSVRSEGASRCDSRAETPRPAWSRARSQELSHAWHLTPFLS